MKTKSSFKDKIAQDVHRQQSAGSSYGYLSLPRNVSVFTPEPGSRVTLDIIPYRVTSERHPDRDDKMEIAMPGTLWYKRPFKIHRNVGSANESLVCLSTFGKKCPICEYRAKRLKEGADKEETDVMKPSLRNLYVVVPIGHKKFKETLHIFDMSQYLFQNLLNDELEENPDNAIFPELEGGLSLKIRFDSTVIGKSQPFAEASRIDFIEREEGYEESLLQTVPNLDDMLQELSYAELQARFLELPTEEDGGALQDDDEDTPPAPVRTRKPAGKGKECPFGHTFGKDCERKDDCDSCDLWEACYDAMKGR